MVLLRNSAICGFRERAPVRFWSSWAGRVAGGRFKHVDSISSFPRPWNHSGNEARRRRTTDIAWPRTFRWPAQGKRPDYEAFRGRFSCAGQDGRLVEAPTRVYWTGGTMASFTGTPRTVRRYTTPSPASTRSRSGTINAGHRGPPQAARHARCIGGHFFPRGTAPIHVALHWPIWLPEVAPADLSTVKFEVRGLGGDRGVRFKLGAGRAGSPAADPGPVGNTNHSATQGRGRSTMGVAGRLRTEKIPEKRP